MTAHRDDVLTDARLEQEIEQALTVDPSPDFLARVRTHIANAPKTSRWSIRWPLVAASAGIFLVVIAVVVVTLLPSRRVVVTGSPVVVRTPEPRPLPQPAAPVMRTEPRRRVPVTARHESRPPATSEVLIPEGEAQALRRLMRGLHVRAVDDTTVAQAAPATAVVDPPTDIVLAPLKPLAPITLESFGSSTRQEGVRQ
jgi:hypothetical protein